MTVFTVVIPARLASSRLERKALADLGGKPMVVRVAERVALSKAKQILVATDAVEIESACQAAGLSVVMTRTDHPSGTDRIAEVVQLMGWGDDDIVVNVQGDEPLIDPELINQVADLLSQRDAASMSTAAHAIDNVAEFTNPNVVKVVIDQAQLALYFSRAPIPWWRDGNAQGVQSLPSPVPLRHIGIYGYRVGFLRTFPQLPPAPVEDCEALEQLRAMWHGHKIAVHVTDKAPGPGVDTPEDLARVRALFKA